jgi:hypothetical protein
MPPRTILRDDSGDSLLSARTGGKALGADCVESDLRKRGSIIFAGQSPHRLKQYGIPVVFEELFLSLRKTPNVGNAVFGNPHSIQEGVWATGEIIKFPESSKLMKHA